MSVKNFDRLLEQGRRQGLEGLLKEARRQKRNQQIDKILILLLKLAAIATVIHFVRKWW